MTKKRIMHHLQCVLLPSAGITLFSLLPLYSAKSLGFMDTIYYILGMWIGSLMFVTPIYVGMKLVKKGFQQAFKRS